MAESLGQQHLGWGGLWAGPPGGESQGPAQGMRDPGAGQAGSTLESPPRAHLRPECGAPQGVQVTGPLCPWVKGGFGCAGRCVRICTENPNSL